MAGLAAAVGVSRQTVYNEVGSKPELARAMVLAELVRFLDVVERAFDAHPEDPVAGVRLAARGVLGLARGNDLLRAVVSASQGADTELLPLLTTPAGSLLTVSREVMARRLTAYSAPVTAAEFDIAIDAIVRVVLSHVMQPSGTPAAAAADIAWTAGRLLRIET